MDRKMAMIRSVTRKEYSYCFSLVIFRLWSSGQNSWLQIQSFRVRFPALPDVQTSSGSREYN
jgi:hypothetical protein